MDELPEDFDCELFDYYYNKDWLIITDDLLYVSPNDKATRSNKLKTVDFWMTVWPPNMESIDWLLKVEQDKIVSKKIKSLKLNHSKIRRNFLEAEAWYQKEYKSTNHSKTETLLREWKDSIARQPKSLASECINRSEMNIKSSGETSCSQSLSQRHTEHLLQEWKKSVDVQ